MFPGCGYWTRGKKWRKEAEVTLGLQNRENIQVCVLGLVYRLLGHCDWLSSESAPLQKWRSPYFGHCLPIPCPWTAKDTWSTGTTHLPKVSFWSLRPIQCWLDLYTTRLPTYTNQHGPLSLNINIQPNIWGKLQARKTKINKEQAPIGQGEREKEQKTTFIN